MFGEQRTQGAEHEILIDPPCLCGSRKLLKTLVVVLADGGPARSILLSTLSTCAYHRIPPIRGEQRSPGSAAPPPPLFADMTVILQQSWCRSEPHSLSYRLARATYRQQNCALLTMPTRWSGVRLSKSEAELLQLRQQCYTPCDEKGEGGGAFSRALSTPLLPSRVDEGHVDDGHQTLRREALRNWPRILHTVHLGRTKHTTRKSSQSVESFEALATQGPARVWGRTDCRASFTNLGNIAVDRSCRREGGGVLTVFLGVVV